MVVVVFGELTFATAYFKPVVGDLLRVSQVDHGTFLDVDACSQRIADAGPVLCSESHIHAPPPFACAVGVADPGPVTVAHGTPRRCSHSRLPEGCFISSDGIPSRVAAHYTIANSS